jgi:hypothetical protein
LVVDLTCQRISGRSSALVLGEQGLAGARLAAHQERPGERDRDVHRVAELVGDDVAGRTLELIEDIRHWADLSVLSQETVSAD